ncbi:MAG: hypothetical protein WA021_00845 [Minisyncoccia bacterium]
MNREEVEAILDERLEKRLARERRWLWSLWRIVPPLLAAYVVTGIYYTLAHPTHPWSRAIGPVIAVATFLLIRPVVQYWWFGRELERDRNEHQDSS